MEFTHKGITKEKMNDIFNKELMIEIDPHRGVYENITIEQLFQLFKTRIKMDVASIEFLIDEIEEREHKLNAWEHDFIANIVSRDYNTLSEDQITVLKKIHEKVTDII